MMAIDSQSVVKKHAVFNTLTANSDTISGQPLGAKTVDPRLVLMAEQLEADRIGYGRINGNGLDSNVFIQNSTDLASNVFIQNSSDLMTILSEQLYADCFWIRNGYQNIYVCNATVFVPVIAGDEVDHYVMTECKNGKCLGDDGHMWSAPNATVFGTLTKYRYLDSDGVEQEETVDPHSVICKNGGNGECVDYATKEGTDLMATLIELTNSDTEQHGSDLMAILSEQLAADRDYGNEHIRGQDWEGEEEGEEERELIVSHGGIMPTVMIATNQWTPPFVVVVGVLTVFAVVMIWRATNIHKKWAKDGYAPIPDGSAKTSHMIYV